MKAFSQGLGWNSNFWVSVKATTPLSSRFIELNSQGNQGSAWRSSGFSKRQKLLADITIKKKSHQAFSLLPRLAISTLRTTGGGEEPEF